MTMRYRLIRERTGTRLSTEEFESLEAARSGFERFLAAFPPAAEETLLLVDSITGQSILRASAYDWKINIPDPALTRVLAEPSPPAEPLPAGRPIPLRAWQCAKCALEFVIVALTGKQTFDDPPYCPSCGGEVAVHRIDCLDFTVVEKVQEYELSSRVKPLPS